MPFFPFSNERSGFKLHSPNRVGSSEIVWSNLVRIGPIAFITPQNGVFNITSVTLGQFSEADAEIAFAPPDWDSATEDWFWITSKNGDYLSIDAGTFPSDWADRAPALHIPSDGSAYLPGETLYFTSSDSFEKADYPGLRAIRVRMVGGGGAGGGADTTAAGQVSAGSGGAGASYAESFILVADLATSEAVTIGAGGAGVSNGNGNNGGDSIFDTVSGEVRAKGGGGGKRGGPTAPPVMVVGGVAQSGSVGDFAIAGQEGGSANYTHLTASRAGGFGGGTMLGGSRTGPDSNAANGISGHGYGGGGTGATNGASQGAARTGGAGANGIVIVELLY